MGETRMSDAEFEEKIEQGEPGINDLMLAYGQLEAVYGQAASAGVSSSDTIITSTTS